MLKSDTLKNDTSRIGLYGSAPPPGDSLSIDSLYLVPFQKKEDRCIIFFGGGGRF